MMAAREKVPVSVVDFANWWRIHVVMPPCTDHVGQLYAHIAEYLHQVSVMFRLM